MLMCTNYPSKSILNQFSSFIFKNPFIASNNAEALTISCIHNNNGNVSGVKWKKVLVNTSRMSKRLHSRIHIRKCRLYSRMPQLFVIAISPLIVVYVIVFSHFTFIFTASIRRSCPAFYWNIRNIWDIWNTHNLNYWSFGW